MKTIQTISTNNNAAVFRFWQHQAHPDHPGIIICCVCSHFVFILPIYEVTNTKFACAEMHYVQLCCLNFNFAASISKTPVLIIDSRRKYKAYKKRRTLKRRMNDMGLDVLTQNLSIEFAQEIKEVWCDPGTLCFQQLIGNGEPSNFNLVLIHCLLMHILHSLLFQQNHLSWTCWPQPYLSTTAGHFSIVWSGLFEKEPRRKLHVAIKVAKGTNLSTCRVDLFLRKWNCCVSWHLVILWSETCLLFYISADFKEKWMVERKWNSRHELKAHFDKRPGTEKWFWKKFLFNSNWVWPINIPQMFCLSVELDLDKSTVQDFLAEALIMRKFKHPNVLTMLGVSTYEGKPCIILPLMTNGDLNKYLRANRTVGRNILWQTIFTNSWPGIVHMSIKDVYQQDFSSGKCIQFALEIAKGMSHLAGQQFVHGDLAARNCLYVCFPQQFNCSFSGPSKFEVSDLWTQNLNLTLLTHHAQPEHPSKDTNLKLILTPKYCSPVFCLHTCVWFLLVGPDSTYSNIWVT